MVIRCRAPLRIEFGGDNTDVAPFPEQYGGVALCAAITKYIYGTLTARTDNCINIFDSQNKQTHAYNNSSEIKYDGNNDLVKAALKLGNYTTGADIFLRSDVPPNAGLSASASTAVAALGLLNHSTSQLLGNHDIAELAYKLVDSELKIKGGRQGQYLSVFGGFKFMEFRGGDNVRVNPVSLSKSNLLELEKHLVLAYVGARKSREDIQNQISEIITNKSEDEKVQLLLDIKDTAYEMYGALKQSDFVRFAQLMSKTWELKKKINLAITTPQIDYIHETAVKTGALGGKILGAGGGGHMLFYCDDNKEHEVAKALDEAGAKVVDFSFDTAGLQTWEVRNRKQSDENGNS